MMELIYQMGDFDLFLDGDSNPTPHLCVMFKSHRTLKFLVGIDVKCCRVRNQLNQTPLMVAASNGNLDAIHIIFGNSSSPSIISDCDQDGYNALHLAVLNEHLKTAELLLNYGADPNSLTSQNHSVLRLIEEIKDPIKKFNFKRLFQPFEDNIKLQIASHNNNNNNNNSVPMLTVIGSTQPPQTTSKKKSSSKSKRDKKQNRQIKQALKQSHQHLDKLKNLIEQKKTKEEQLKLSKQKKQLSEEEREIEKRKQIERRKQKRQKLEEQKKKLRADKKAQLHNQSKDPNSTTPPSSDLNDNK